MKKKHNPSSHIIVAIVLTTSSACYAANPHDDYYSNDIFEAIDEAKKRPHHYDYSRGKRYNRTTKQSLDIPPMLNSEMKETTIESVSDTSQSPSEQQARSSEAPSLDKTSGTLSDTPSTTSPSITTYSLPTNPNVDGSVRTSVTVR